jgi:hypothetical protein
MRPFALFNPWAAAMAGPQPPDGILGQDYPGPIARQLPSLPPRAPGMGTGVHLRQMYDPETPPSPQTADRMPQFGAPLPSLLPLGGAGMPTMMQSSPPLYTDESKGVTPQSNLGSGATPMQMAPSPQTPPFDVADYLRRLYAASGVGQ